MTVWFDAVPQRLPAQALREFAVESVVVLGPILRRPTQRRVLALHPPSPGWRRRALADSVIRRTLARLERAAGGLTAMAKSAFESGSRWRQLARTEFRAWCEVAFACQARALSECCSARARFHDRAEARTLAWSIAEPVACCATVVEAQAVLSPREEMVPGAGLR